MIQTDLTVIGGGASGMTAAICAAAKGLHVTIIEHNQRVGKKILSTGNGRCNLSNVNVSASDYRGSGTALLQGVLDRYGTEETAAFFRRIGVPLRTEEGRIYPRTMQAKTVLDALRFEIDRQEIGLRTEETITSVKKSGNRFLLLTSTGDKIETNALLFAVGGKAAPKSGSDGSANRLIRSLGHSITEQQPALTPLVTDAPYRRALKGLRIDGTAELYVNGAIVQKEQGQIQFTETGISGIPVFDLSGAASEALSAHQTVQVCLDFLPDLRISQVEEELLERIHTFSGDRIETILNGFLPKKLVIELCKICGMRPSDSLAALFPDMAPEHYSLMPLPGQLREFAWQCKGLFQHITGTMGFDPAQTTAGGIPAGELTPDLESAIVPGLFFAGEIIDLCGRCGGYNLQWAWSSGMAAADAALAYCRRQPCS